MTIVLPYLIFGALSILVIGIKIGMLIERRVWEKSL